MQRIQHFAISIAGTCGLLLLGCQPNTSQSEPPTDESATPGQTQPMDDNAAMPEENDDENQADQDQTDEKMAAGAPQDEGLSPEGEQFIEEAAQGGMAEVELSKIAVEKVKDKKVRDFAQMMIDDHTKANEELTTLATKLGATVPTEPSEGLKQKMAELEKLDAKKLADKYVDIMVDDHEKAVELFRDESERDGDPELQQFAAKTLPKLKEHLDRIKAIDEGKPYKGPQARAPEASAPGKVASKSKP